MGDKKIYIVAKIFDQQAALLADARHLMRRVVYLAHWRR